MTGIIIIFTFEKMTKLAVWLHAKLALFFHFESEIKDFKSRLFIKYCF